MSRHSLQTVELLTLAVNETEGGEEHKWIDLLQTIKSIDNQSTLTVYDPTAWKGTEFFVSPSRLLLQTWKMESLAWKWTHHIHSPKESSFYATLPSPTISMRRLIARSKDIKESRHSRRRSSLVC